MSQFEAFTFERLCKELSEPENTLIICHTLPDGDARNKLLNLIEAAVDEA